MNDGPEWQRLKSEAVWLRHQGEIDGAIVEMLNAIQLTRATPALAERSASYLNYLADLYLAKEATDQAEAALTESIALCRAGQFAMLPDDLLMLSEVQCRKGDYQAAATSAEEARRLYHQQGHDYGVGQADNMIDNLKARV